MKRFLKSMQGVTLLEVMLVLAVAAMIIVMSVRYYQSATANQQVNNVLEEIQAVTAAGDGFAQSNGSYSGVTNALVATQMPNGQMNTAWGGTIAVSAQTATGYTVTITAMPGNVCSALKPKLSGNSKYNTTGTTCAANGASGTFTYKYNSQG